MASTRDLPTAYDRVAIAAWAAPYGTDVARAVRECQDAGVLRALGFELGQALVVARFEERVLNATPQVSVASRIDHAMAYGPTSETFAARIEELRSALDVGLMQHALEARPHDETIDEREERVIAGALADEERLVREKGLRAAERLFAAVGLSVLRQLRREAIERYNALRAPLRKRRPRRGA